LKLQVTRKRASAALVSLALCMLAGCAADRVRDDAEQLMAQGDYEHAVQALEAGAARYPDSVQLRSRLVLARAQAQSQLIEQARVAEANSDMDRAEMLLRRATAFDGSAQRAAMLLADLQVARNQRDALQRANTLAGKGQTDAALRLVDQALKDNRRDPALLALQHRLQIDQRQAQVRASQQGLAETRPVSLDFRDANVRNVLEVVGRNSGINIVLDKDVKDQRVTVYAKSVRFDDALDMILNTGQLSRKVLDSKTVLVYPNTPDKQREHQEQLVKVFYLANGDAKGAAAFLKSMMKLREPYVDDHSNMLALRDSLENIQLAERLIALFDNPEPEVLLEAEVLEVSADRLTELGVSLPTQVTLTPLTLAGGTNLTLDSFPLHRGNIGVGIPGATINAKRTVGDVNTLANPKIRTRSGEKAKVLIGDKIPIITTTTTPGVAGFVSETVSYQDVGIKLEVEPKVYPDDDVSIRLNLEVSALGTQTKTATGTIAYQISTRNASTLLRLRDGETQLLAGLISTDERASTAGLPGLADVPLLGRLFSDQTNSHSKTELVLSITPHIVRGQPHLDATESEAWVGTEMYQRLKPVGGRFDNEPPAGSAVSTPVQGRASMAPLPGNGASAPGGAVPQAAAEHVNAGSPAAIAWSAPASVKVGQVFTTQLRLRTGVALGSIALSLQYPSDLLGLVGFADAQDMPEAAAPGMPAAHNEPGGKGVIDLERVVANPSDVPLSLVLVQFKALKAGEGSVEVKARPADPAVNVTAPPAWSLKVEP
jgi:general secretion pathway protein D